MPQILPGWGGDLGNALASLADGIRTVQDPHWKTKQALEEHLMTDPAAAEAFVRQGIANPAAYKKLGLDGLMNKFADYHLQAGSIAINQAISAANAPDAASNPQMQYQTQKILGGGADTSQVAKNTLDTTVSQAGSEAIVDPAVRARAGQTAASGQTNDQALATKQTVLNGQARIDEANRKEAERQTYETLYKTKYAGKDINKIIAQSIDGGIPIEDMNALDQATSGNFTQLRAQEIQRRHNNQIEWARQQYETRMANRAADTTDKVELHAQQAEGRNRYNKSSTGGDPETWRRYLYDPATIQRTAQLVADPTQIKTPEDRNLFAIAQYEYRERAAQNNAGIVKNNQVINQTMRALQNRRVTPEEASGYLTTINGALAERSQLNPIYGDIHADYGIPSGKEAHWYNSVKPQLLFKDAQGNLLDPNKVSAEIHVPDKLVTPTGQGLPSVFNQNAQANPNISMDAVNAGLTLWDNRPAGMTREAFLTMARQQKGAEYAAELAKHLPNK